MPANILIKAQLTSTLHPIPVQSKSHIPYHTVVFPYLISTLIKLSRKQVWLNTGASSFLHSIQSDPSQRTTLHPHPILTSIVLFSPCLHPHTNWELCYQPELHIPSNQTYNHPSSTFNTCTLYLIRLRVVLPRTLNCHIPSNPILYNHPKPHPHPILTSLV